ncbi:MAG TPA: hypothetical protein VIK86_10320 [Candidatus Paceibacterota bacterium]
MRDLVKQYIEENFILDKVILKDCLLLPGGVYLTDQSGDTLLFYYDVNVDEIKFKEGKNV